MEDIIKLIGDYKIIYPGRIVSKSFGFRKLYLSDQLDYWEGIKLPKSEDDLDDTASWIHSSQFPNYIQSNYGLDSQEYHNLVVYGDINYRHICECPGCNNFTEFRNTRSGYASYCSTSCSAVACWNDEDWVNKVTETHKSKEYREYMSNLKKADWMNEAYRSKVIESHIKTQNTPEYKRMVRKQMEDLWHNPESAYRRSADISKGTYLSNLGNLTKLIFYVLTFKDYFKVGISMNVGNRLNSISNDYTILDHCEYIGDAIDVIEFEYQFKINNYKNSLAFLEFDKCTKQGWSEVFKLDCYPELISGLSKTNFTEIKVNLTNLL